MDMSMQDGKVYEIDFDKVNDIEDIKNILAALRIEFSSIYVINNEQLKPYIKEKE